MTNAKTGWGGEFWLDNASGTPVELVEVKSVTLPNGETEQLDATHLKSPNRRREFIAGMIDDGEMSVVMNYVGGSTTDVLLETALDDGDARTWTVKVPKASGFRVYEGEGFVLTYEKPEMVADAVMEATVTIKPSGAYTVSDA